LVHCLTVATEGEDVRSLPICIDIFAAAQSDVLVLVEKALSPVRSFVLKREVFVWRFHINRGLS